MKERILVVIACILSCVIIFGSIIAYKEHRKANVDVEMSQSTTDEKTEENTFAEEKTTTQDSEETTLKSEETTSNRTPAKDKRPVPSTETIETTTKKDTVESTTESTIEETTTEGATEETTTEKVYPVLAESKADMIRLINSLTANASQGNYTLTRNCYAEDEFCASDMEKLNEIVQNVNPNATFNSAFNKHVNAGTTKANIQNGKATTDIRKEYLLIAMSITEDDIRNWRQRDNKIMVNLIDSYNYFIFEHVTNDFITVNTINQFISKYTMGYQVKGAHTGYGPLSLEVTIDDGKLTNLKINHSVHIDVEFESSNRMDGDYTTEITYSDIVYK